MQKVSLKRLTLDELAEVLPALKEKEQCECIAGTYYYGTNGVFLGSSGSSSTIMVTRPTVTYDSSGMLVTIYDGEYFSMQETNNVEKLNIVNSMARSLGYWDYVDIKVMSENGTYNLTTGEMFLNTNFIAYSNYNDIMLLLTHEIHHANNSYSNTNWAEYYAYKAQMESSYFSLASSGYRSDVEQNFKNYRKKVLGY